MKAVKKWEKLFYEVKGNYISVKLSEKYWSFYGIPIGWSGMYVTFKDVVFWNGKTDEEYTIHAKWIKGIKYGKHNFDEKYTQ